jgi:hypothetical protein
MHDIPHLFTGRVRSCLPSDATLSAADYPVDLGSATGVKLLKPFKERALPPLHVVCSTADAVHAIHGYSDYMEETCLVSGHKTRNTNRQLGRSEMRRTPVCAPHVLTDRNTTGHREQLYL